MLTYESIPNPARDRNTGAAPPFGTKVRVPLIGENSASITVTPELLAQVDKEDSTSSADISTRLSFIARRVITECLDRLVIVKLAGFSEEQEAADDAFLSGLLAGAVDIVKGSLHSNDSCPLVKKALNKVRQKREKSKLSSAILAYVATPYEDDEMAVGAISAGSAQGGVVYLPLWCRVAPERAPKDCAPIDDPSTNINIARITTRIYLPPSSRIPTGPDLRYTTPKHTPVDAYGDT
jgi:hypothetical protein